METTIPSCEVLSDCPAGQGYTGCIDGWCHAADSCTSRQAVAGDGCCALIEGDRSADLDCLLRDMQLSCLEPAGPAVDDYGNMFVSCLTDNDNGAHNVVLRRLDPEGILSVPVVVGTGTVARNPVRANGDTLIVQAQESVRRYLTGTLAPVDSFDTVNALSSVATNSNSSATRTISVWPGTDGRVHLFDENRGSIFSYGVKRSELALAGAFRPTISWTGRRSYVTWKSGTVDVVETGANPLGVVLSADLPALPAGPAIDVDGFIYVAMKDGRLARFSESARVSLSLDWSIDIFDGQPVDQVWLLVREDNAVVVVSGSGEVQVILDMDTFGSIVATGSFSYPLADIHPILAESGRVIAVSSSGKIVSVLAPDSKGRIEPGLEFSVPSMPASDLVLSGDSLVYASESGSIMVWSYPDGPSNGRWACAGGNSGFTGRTSEPDRTGADN